MTRAPDRNFPRRGILWFGSVAMLLFTALMAVFFSQAGWHTPQLAFVGICGAITFGLGLILVNASRFFWVIRVATFVVFAVSFWYVVDQGFIHRHPLSIGDPSAPSFFNSVRGFLFFGLPCLLYTLWGSPWGKLGGPDPRKVTRADFLILKLAIYGRWISLGMTLLVLALLMVRH
jgi:hypothetical protein